MMIARETVDVAATPHQVWAVLSDVLRWPEWTPTVSDVAALDGGLLHVGARFRLAQPRLPRAVWTVAEVVPGRSFTWTASSLGVTSRGVHEVEPSGGGSRVVLAFEQSGRLAPLTARLFGRLVSSYVQQEGAGLKTHVEGGYGVRTD